MGVVVYGDGTLYGDADAFYGRISAALAQAQQTVVRETGLQVRVIDERVNEWEVVNDVGEIITQSLNDNNDTRSPGYWGYRGASHVIKLSGGNIIRARIGTPGDASDRQIYVQTITDPTDPLEWQSWTLLYSGTHYAIALRGTGASTYDVYHTKAGAGLCKNNSVLFATATDGQSLADGIRIQLSDLSAAPRYMYITVPKTYAWWRASNALRVFDLYVTSDADSNQPTASVHNFKWTRNTVRLVEDPTDSNYWLLYRSFQIHNNPRLMENGESMTVTRFPAGSTELIRPNTYAPLVLRGLSNQGGHHIINLVSSIKANDGYVYLFFSEIHVDDNFVSLQSGTFLFWQRSKDGIHWSEPVLSGIPITFAAGLFEHDDYMYICGSGVVYRRPTTPVEHVLDDYVPSVSFDIPRDNQEGQSQVLIANPDGINDAIESLSDARIRIRPGLKLPDGTYEFVDLNDFWIKKPTKVIEGEINRITLAVGDVWTRLQEKFRDTINIIGHTTWSDWQPGTQNEAFNYFFESGEGTIVEDFKLQVSGGRVLWTGWKGHNASWSFSFAGGACEFYARYVDENNFLRFVYSGSTVSVYSMIEAGETLVATFSTSSGLSQLYVELRWGYIRVQHGQTLIGEVTLTDPVLTIGYIGWNAGDTGLTISYFSFNDWEQDITSHSLIKSTLAAGDYHDVIVGGPNGKHFAEVWGPQTDIQSPADALRQLLEAEKLELIWKDGFITVGQFTATSPIRTLQNEVFSTDYVEEAIRRLNLVIIDGNEHSWFEADAADTQQRDRQIVGYFDIPELLTQDDVRARAREELRRSKAGQSPGANIPLQLDLWRMDPIIIVDNSGVERNVRIEGIRVTINQSTAPFQREELDTSLI